MRAWKEAMRRCRHLMSGNRRKTLLRVLGVTVIQYRMALLKSLCSQAREALLQDRAASQAPQEIPDTRESLAVAFCVSATEAKEVVEEMLESDPLREYLGEQEMQEPTEFFLPDWVEDEDALPDDSMQAQPAGPGVSTGSGTSATAPSETVAAGAAASLAASSSEPAASSMIAATSSNVPPHGSVALELGQNVGTNAPPWLVYNKKKQPCAHWEREDPPYALGLDAFDKLKFACADTSQPFLLQHVREFFQKYGCEDKVLPPTQRPLRWGVDSVASDVGNEVHDVGVWYRFPLARPNPEPLPDTDITNPEAYRHAWGDYRRCLHATNMYVLPKILREGMEPSELEGKGGRTGVYCYPMTKVTLGIKSSGYCMYTCPREDGWFWGARMELQVAMGLSHTKGIAVGADQLCAWKGCYSATAVWLHIIHQTDLRKAWQAPMSLWYLVDKWRPEFMVP